MKKTVHIENIGIIENSTVVLDGLTVITGHNNSGKTTVGKALYSVLSAVENLQSDAFTDKIAYARAEARKLRDMLEMRNRVFRRTREARMDENSEVVKASALKRFLQAGIGDSFENISELMDYLDRVYHEVEEISDDSLKEIIYGKNYEKASEDIIKNARQNLLDGLEKLEDNLCKDEGLLQYANRKIAKTLMLEFNAQILPVRYPEKVGKISMEDELVKYFSVDIEHNDIPSGKQVYFNRAYMNAIFIDDVYVIDRIDDGENLWMYLKLSHTEEDWRDGGVILGHNEILENELAKEPNNIFQEVLNQKTAKILYDKLESVFPDQIILSKDRYICSNSKLDVRNLATGSKMFAIIKKLIENEQISNGTLLILDEPESHLHPAWQNQFAEIVVLMVKYLNVDVLLTTHSPNFLMALEVYAKQYKVWEHTNMYCTESNDKNGMIHYVDVKDNMKIAYEKLANPLFELRALEIKNDADEEEEM